MRPGFRAFARPRNRAQFLSLRAWPSSCIEGTARVYFPTGIEFVPRKTGHFPCRKVSRGVVKTYTGAGRFWIRARQLCREAVEG